MEPYHLLWAKPVEAIEMKARYPVVALSYRDSALDKLRVKAIAELASLLVPGDLRTSSTPAMPFRLKVINNGVQGSRPRLWSLKEPCQVGRGQGEEPGRLCRRIDRDNNEGQGLSPSAYLAR